MQLKGNPEFSKEDIFRSFADVTRGDIYFGKISQNIDEMYLSEEQKETIQAIKKAIPQYEELKTVKIVKRHRNCKKIKQKLYGKTGLRVGIVQ